MRKTIALLLLLCEAGCGMDFAAAQTDDDLYPPAKYDHPVDEMKVRMTLTRVDIAGMHATCDRVAWKGQGYLPAGCSKISPDGGNCNVYILHDSILQRYHVEFMQVFRHERAHCNGWRHFQAYK